VGQFNRIKKLIREEVTKIFPPSAILWDEHILQSWMASLDPVRVASQFSNLYSSYSPPRCLLSLCLVNVSASL
jgi:hypothetical protein